MFSSPSNNKNNDTTTNDNDNNNDNDNTILIGSISSSTSAINTAAYNRRGASHHSTAAAAAATTSNTAGSRSSHWLPRTRTTTTTYPMSQSYFQKLLVGVGVKSYRSESKKKDDEYNNELRQPQPQPQKQSQQQKLRLNNNPESRMMRYSLPILFVACCLWVIATVMTHSAAMDIIIPTSHKHEEAQIVHQVVHLPFMDRNFSAGASKDKRRYLPSALAAIRDRAKNMKEKCIQLDDNKNNKLTSVGFDQRYEIYFGVNPDGVNESVATLPAFGILDTLEQYVATGGPSWNFTNDEADVVPSYIPNDSRWQCQLPPATECGETQFTVIFMAYNPDRLSKTFSQILLYLKDPAWMELVSEVVIVWNGPRNVDESEAGRTVLEFAKHNHNLRIVYPLKMGLKNDLMNRYHPYVVEVNTKAILYYDDDGPFYMREAVVAGFELWKRHANAQIGAMSRQINYGPRQAAEHKNIKQGLAPNQPADQFFVSHCPNLKDQVEYNFRYFANYNANMVLPSGSFLHSDYLCFLWHPALLPIRQFVRAHPVHPDDVTVSMIVSQLSGRAPRVYSRRLKAAARDGDKEEEENGAKQQQRHHQRRRQRLQARKLTEEEETEMEGDVHSILSSQDGWDEGDMDDPDAGLIPISERQRHRSLLFGINWDADHAMSDAKQYWADLRSEAVNSLVQFFGSLNSGSIGWCEGTPYYDEKMDGWCNPVMARQGWLPWMNADNTPKDTCP